MDRDDWFFTFIIRGFRDRSVHGLSGTDPGFPRQISRTINHFSGYRKLIRKKRIQKKLDGKKDRIKVVSFDIYDTLLIRKMPFEKVFHLSAKMMCEKLFQDHGIRLSPEEILSHRMVFKESHDKMGLSGNLLHQSLAKPVSIGMGDNGIVQGAKPDQREGQWNVSMWIDALCTDFSLKRETIFPAARQCELEAEFTGLALADEAMECLEYVQSLGIMVIAVSDMWLEEDWMKDLVFRFHLPFTHIYTSAGMDASKRKGTIFPKIEKELGFHSRAFLHIGDNPKADWYMPKKAGWQILPLIHRHTLARNRIPVHNLLVKKSLPKSEEILQLLELAPAPKEKNPFYRLAYDYLCPLLILFSISQWRRFREQEVDSVFFVARDAKAMFDVYNRIRELLPESPQGFYVRLSRRVLAASHPDNLLMNVMHLAGKAGKKKVSHWLDSFCLSPELRMEILQKAGIPETALFSDSTRDALVQATGFLERQIREETVEQAEMVRDYLKEQAKTSPMKRVGLVDSGWACTTQDCLRNILIDTQVLSGMYFGVSKQGRAPDDFSLKYGFLRDDFRNLRHMNPLESTAGVVRLWDTLLREPAGTVNRLERDATGMVVPVLSDTSAICEEELSAAFHIQEGIHAGVQKRMQFIELLVRYSPEYSDYDLETAASEISGKITTRPSRKMARAILSLHFDEAAAGGKTASFGIRGIREGVAWYPGILSSVGLSFLTPILSALARLILIQKLGSPAGKTIPFQ